MYSVCMKSGVRSAHKFLVACFSVIVLSLGVSSCGNEPTSTEIGLDLGLESTNNFSYEDCVEGFTSLETVNGEQSFSDRDIYAACGHLR